MRKAARAKPKDASKAHLAEGAAGPARRRRAAAGTDRPAAAARIDLAAECILRDAAALQALLAGTFSPTDSVIVAAGAVTRIDTAALQLLVAFTRRETAAGRRVIWLDPSADFVSASARLGLTGILGLSEPAGGTA